MSKHSIFLGILSVLSLTTSLAWGGWSLMPSDSGRNYVLFFKKEATDQLTPVATLTPKLQDTKNPQFLEKVSSWMVVTLKPSSSDIQNVKKLWMAGKESGTWEVKTKDGTCVDFRVWKEDKGYGYPVKDKIIMEFQTTSSISSKERKALGTMLPNDITGIEWNSPLIEEVRKRYPDARTDNITPNIENFENFSSLAASDWGKECLDCFEFSDLGRFATSLPRSGWSLGASEDRMSFNLFLGRLSVGTLTPKARYSVSNKEKEISRWVVSNFIPSAKDMQAIKTMLQQNNRSASWEIKMRNGETIPVRVHVPKAVGYGFEEGIDTLRMQFSLETDNVSAILNAIPSDAHKIVWNGINPQYPRQSMDNFSTLKELQESPIAGSCQSCFG